MSTWQVGRVYDYYGTAIVCLDRYFGGESGTLELVDLARLVEIPLVPVVETRSARTLAPCVKPIVTETLGGVCRPDACHHDWYASLVANAGPNAGKRCCSGCGGAL